MESDTSFDTINYYSTMSNTTDTIDAGLCYVCLTEVSYGSMDTDHHKSLSTYTDMCAYIGPR